MKFLKPSVPQRSPWNQVFEELLVLRYFPFHPCPGSRKAASQGRQNWQMFAAFGNVHSIWKISTEMPKCGVVSMSLITDWLHWFTPMPPYHNGSQRSHRTFHIVPWQSHHTFKTLILHIQQIHPSIPWTPNFQLPACVSAWSFKHVHLLNNRFLRQKKPAQLDVATCGTRWGPATPQRTKSIQSRQGQVIQQMGSERYPKKDLGNTDLLFFEKKEC